jgi:N-acetyltransferase
VSDFDRQPTLRGAHLVLRPLRADDEAAVTVAAADAELWAQHPASNRNQADVFATFFADRLASGGTLVIIDEASGEVVGWSSYGVADEALGEVEVGWTFLVRSRWGGTANRELKELMLAHAFATFPTVTFRIAATNMRSRKGTEKLGAALTDRTTAPLIAGVPVPHVVYTITADQLGATRRT